MNITPIAVPQNPHNEDTITRLDPSLIRLPKHPNRDETFFKSPTYFALRAAILTTRGNAVPVRVHPISGDPSFLYVADYGICRIRCCLELGFDVTAIVSSTNLSEQMRLFQRVQENSCRSDFCPVDLGRIYLDALERKLVANQLEFAHECGRDTGLLSKAIKLASLPPAILDLFDQVQDIQYRYYKPLWDAYNGPRKADFLDAVESVEQLPRPRNPYEIVAVLTGKGQEQKSVEPTIEPFKPAIETTLRWRGKPAGNVILMEDGGVEITLYRKLEVEKYEELAKTLQSFLDRSGGKRSEVKSKHPKGAGALARGRAAELSVIEPVNATLLDLDLDLDLNAVANAEVDNPTGETQA